RVLSIPGDVMDWELRPMDGVKCVIVCEKETIFSHLIQTGLLETLPCILITGQGFPSIGTRTLIARLEAELHLPIYGVFDYNVGELCTRMPKLRIHVCGREGD
ncbi:hypothetical protein SARC_12668, partial [Sphaeroforma arctica JP610]